MDTTSQIQDLKKAVNSLVSKLKETSRIQITNVTDEFSDHDGTADDFIKSFVLISSKTEVGISIFVDNLYIGINGKYSYSIPTHRDQNLLVGIILKLLANLEEGITEVGYSIGGRKIGSKMRSDEFGLRELKVLKDTSGLCLPFLTHSSQKITLR